MRPALAVSAIATLAGLMFAISAQLAHGTSGLRQPAGLTDMVRAEQRRVEELTERVDILRAEVEILSQGSPASVKENPAAVLREGVHVGTVPVHGPGIRIELDDAPASSANIPGATPDTLVIHQQDIQHVINALWAGGAEAMTLQGERVIMTSAFRCSGSILLLHGRVFSPPYVIEAIGDPERLAAAIEDSPRVANFRQHAAIFGLGWSTQELADVEMPAYSGSTNLLFATLPEGTDPLR